MVVAGAIYKNWVDSKNNTGVNANAQTANALATMSKLNQMLVDQNTILEGKVNKLQELVEGLRTEIASLRRQLEGWRP